MQGHPDQNFASSHGLGAGIPSNHPYASTHAVAYNLQGTSYAQYANGHIQNTYIQPKDMNSQGGINAAAENLAHVFNGVNIRSVGTSGPHKIGGHNSGTSMITASNLNGTQPGSQFYYQLPDGRLFFGNMGTSQSTCQPSVGAYSVTPTQAQYLQQANYHVNTGVPNMTQGVGWNMAQQFSRDMPDLATTHRNSVSSNEENGPRTPFFGAHSQSAYQPKVAISDNSPLWSTPSPPHLGQPAFPHQIAKSPTGQYVHCDFDALCQQDPAIPKPVPAIFSGEKGRGTLEKSLHNQTNTTNVYIRGLHPDTTDEMLHTYGVRFGDIQSAKSMLDQHTGLCKGFGFIKYHNFYDGENCIRAFFHWGYEAKWARVSHNEKLKTLGDESNTNLYISNLPVSFNEYTLKAIFTGYQVESTRILRDSNAISRGVGFARFATPEICDEIIQKFNGQLVGDEGVPLNIRYADTEAQKQLKNVTAERRQFKTNEYNTVVYGSASPYVQSPLSATFPSPLQGRAPGSNGFWSTQVPVSPLYQAYPVPTPYVPQTIPLVANLRSSAENIVPAGIRFSSRIKIESPSVSALAKRANGDRVSSQSPVKSSGESGLSNGEAALGYQSEARSSPSKSSPAKSLASHNQARV